MASPHRNVENFLKVEDGDGEENMDRILAKLQTLTVEDTTETLRSRIHEQSSLICMLNQRADHLLSRCDALQKINTELERQMKDCQTELESERKKSDLLERRFMDLAANNQAIISFMEDYKHQNCLLKQENKQLQVENDTLFSRKLQDKEVFVEKLMQDIKQLRAKNKEKENEYRENLAGYQSKLKTQVAQYEAKEALLCDQVFDAQRQQKEAVEMCTDLKMKLKKAEEDHALQDSCTAEQIARLNKEKDKLLHLSMERRKIIKMKQEEIQELATKWKEEKKRRTKAEERFQREAEAVNADLKVKSLQSALDQATTKYEEFKKDFEACKEHSNNLLLQERELNKKLRHMMG